MYLSEEIPFTIEVADWAANAETRKHGIKLWARAFLSRFHRRNPEFARLKGDNPTHEWVSWRNSHHTEPPRLGLVILAGARVVFGPIYVPQDGVGFCVVGPALPEISPDGFDVFVRFRPSDGTSETTLATRHIEAFDSREPWSKILFPVQAVAGETGSFIVECDPGPQHDPRADWLGLYEFVVSSESSLRLNRARALKQYRMRNELSFFGQVYEHPMYRSDDGHVASPKEQQLRDDERVTEKSPEDGPACDDSPSEPKPPDAYGLSFQLLADHLQRPTPDFFARLHDRLSAFSTSHPSPALKLRVLSLCSGAARYEKEFVRNQPHADRLDLTLLDINSPLLDKGRNALSNWCSVQTVVCDVNRLDLQGERYDIVLCISGLHHLVELERVMDVIAGGLRDGGEFWSVGEYVGRNGNRLWPEAYGVANSFFRSLPEKYRVCRNPGAEPRVHEELPNMDCSINTFEGIRSEDIENCIARHFTPFAVDTRCCFTWRLFDLAYLDNYDTRLPEDYAIVRRAVDLEIDHYTRGGRPTVLNGIYTKRT